MQAGQPGRRRPPNRRLCETFVFEVDGLRFTATVSRSEDGKPLELSHGRPTGPLGVTLDLLADDGALL
jgi:hypothetical protein